MIFKVAIVAAVLSLASAGFDANTMTMMMQMMMGMKQNQTQQAPQPQTGGCANGQCSIPSGVDVATYMEQQKQQQQYQQQQMSAKIKAQFDKVISEVKEKKQRYAMGVMTEITSMCGCLQQQLTVYQTMFVSNAVNLNLTDSLDVNQGNKQPFQATSLKEARELVFSGLLRELCEKLGVFMTFAEQVENQITMLNQGQVIG